MRIELLSFAIEEVVTAPRSPWQSPYVERVIGSIRRECLDHVIVLNERHLRAILLSYIDYYQRSRSYVRKLVTELSGGVFGYLDSVLERHSFDEFGELI